METIETTTAKRIFITIVHFTAFNNDQKISFEDDAPLMEYNIRRRIRIICPTSRILRIKHYEAVLLHEEVVEDKNNGLGAKAPAAKQTTWKKH